MINVDPAGDWLGIVAYSKNSGITYEFYATRTGLNFWINGVQM